MMRLQIARWLGRPAAAGLVALLISACAPIPPATGAAAVSAPPTGMARIWFYRDNEPYISLARPYVRLNGRIVGISEPGGAFYRDVAPGFYHATVDCQGRAPNQFAHIAVAPGQQVYLKVQDDPFWASGGGRAAWRYDTFYTVPMLPQVAVPEVERLPFYGGS